MKATFELPDDLFKQLKLRAVRDGVKLKDAAAEVLRAGLEARPASAVQPARIGKDKQTGLPVILGGRPAAIGDEVTPERVSEILSEQETEWSRDSG